MAVAILLLGTLSPGLAGTLRVALCGSQPFVIPREGGIWTGLSVEIWEKIAAINHWDYKFIPFADDETAMKSLLHGEADVLVGNVPISTETAKYCDLSQPYYRAGLQIMISDARPHTLAKLFEYASQILRLKVLWIVLIVLLLLSLPLQFFERKHNPDFPKGWHEGFVEAFYYLVSVALTGKSVYKGFPGILGRMMLIFWMFAGMLAVAFVTSAITAKMTVESLQAHINGPQDLPGKKVGAVQETAAIDYLQRHNVDTQIFPSLAEAVQALVAGHIRAIVGAAPILEFYDNQHQEIPITEVGPVFSPYNYGFAVPVGSSLRQPIDSSLLQLQESGVLTELGVKIFGPVYQP